jgi:mutator protein MutT
MPSIRVIAAVITKGEKLLVCQRPPHKRHGDLWEFPGGKLEPGEDDETAARRELAEELGIHVESIGDPEFEIADAGLPFLVAFIPVEASGTPVCHEHTALTWGTPSELATLPLAPSDRRYVEFLLARAAV